MLALYYFYATTTLFVTISATMANDSCRLMTAPATDVDLCAGGPSPATPVVGHGSNRKTLISALAVSPSSATPVVGGPRRSAIDCVRMASHGWFAVSYWNETGRCEQFSCPPSRYERQAGCKSFFSVSVISRLVRMIVS